VAYCTIEDLRDEGVDETAYPDPVLTRRITLACAQIDRWTGRFFEPRDLVLRVDGNGHRVLLLGAPIIAIEGIVIADQFGTASDVDLDTVRVYNRHLSGMLDEDDRENPKIEWLLEEAYRIVFGRGWWPRGTQNVEITGTFGYTDPDVGGSAEDTGITPELIRYAAILLVVRNLAPLSDTDAHSEAVGAHRVIGMRTAEQSIGYASPVAAGGGRMIGAFSGDPEIDGIIAGFCRLPSMGAV
jgi:hypothetical protein